MNRAGAWARALLWGVGATAGLVALASVWCALRAPWELEAREGTVWLHVLAQDAGRSLYDTHEVAFVNMNHGPLDPLVKHWLHAVAPGLPAQVVTRCFALALPLALLLLFATVTRRLRLGLLLGGGTYVFLLGLGQAELLVGRSDATALTLLCALLAVGDVIRRADDGSPRRSWLLAVIAGLLAMAVGLTNWRYAPVAFGLVLVFAIEFACAGVARREPLERDEDDSGPTRSSGPRAELQSLRIAHEEHDSPLSRGPDGRSSAPQSLSLSPSRRFGRGRTIAFVLLAVVAAAALWCAQFLLLFGGDWQNYWKHFFGIFTPASGWGLHGRMPFDGLPPEVSNGRGLIHFALGVLVLRVIRDAWPAWRTRIAAIAWVALIVAAWISTSLGYAWNHGAGGAYYYAPVYVVIAAFIASHVSWNTIPWVSRCVLGTILVVGLPWTADVAQVRRLHQAAKEGAEFSRRVAVIVGRDEPYSEDVHLFKTSYEGEVLDMGDMDATLAATGYFGKAFTALVENHAAMLERRPPRFVLCAGDGVVSPALHDLLRRRYRRIAASGPVIVAQSIPVTLYELAPPSGPRYGFVGAVGFSGVDLGASGPSE